MQFRQLLLPRGMSGSLMCLMRLKPAQSVWCDGRILFGLQRVVGISRDAQICTHPVLHARVAQRFRGTPSHMTLGGGARCGRSAGFRHARGFVRACREIVLSCGSTAAVYI